MQRATSHAKIFPEILSEQCAMQEHRIVEEAGRNQMQVQSGTTLDSAIQRYTTLYGAAQRYATHADAIQTLCRRYADAIQRDTLYSSTALSNLLQHHVQLTMQKSAEAQP